MRIAPLVVLTLLLSTPFILCDDPPPICDSSMPTAREWDCDCGIWGVIGQIYIESSWCRYQNDPWVQSRCEMLIYSGPCGFYGMCTVTTALAFNVECTPYEPVESPSRAASKLPKCSEFQAIFDKYRRKDGKVDFSSLVKKSGALYTMPRIEAGKKAGRPILKAGYVTFAVTVDKSGKVTNIQYLKQPNDNPEFKKDAVANIRTKWKFKATGSQYKIPVTVLNLPVKR